MRRALLYHVGAIGCTPLAVVIAATAVAATTRVQGDENGNFHMYNTEVVCVRGPGPGKSTSLSCRRHCCIGGHRRPLCWMSHSLQQGIINDY